MADPVSIAIIAGTTLLTSSMTNRASRSMTNMSAQQAQQQLAFQREQQAKLDKQKAIYSEMQFANPYAGVQNYYEGLENTMEDLTVSTQAADFQMERGEQQRAGILNALRGAAGGAGIAALAQQLANQGVLQAAQVSAQIAQQERQNQLAQAQAADQLQFAEAQGMSAADMARRGGEAMVQQGVMSRQSTLLGVDFQGLAGANAGVQSAFANQMSAQQAGMQMQMANMQMLTNMGTQLYLGQ